MAFADTLKTPQKAAPTGKLPAPLPKVVKNVVPKPAAPVPQNAPIVPVKKPGVVEWFKDHRDPLLVGTLSALAAAWLFRLIVKR